jgi:hypothetical protein
MSEKENHKTQLGDCDGQGVDVNSAAREQNSTSPTPEDSSTITDSDERNDNTALLAKIAELEKENQQLLKERETFKNSIVINTNDVYANLQQLQANFAEKAAKSYEAVRNVVPDSDNIGFDLKP